MNHPHPHVPMRTAKQHNAELVGEVELREMADDLAGLIADYPPDQRAKLAEQIRNLRKEAQLWKRRKTK